MLILIEYQNVLFAMYIIINSEVFSQEIDEYHITRNMIFNKKNIAIPAIVNKLFWFSELCSS